MSFDDVRYRLIFRPAKQSVLQSFVFEVLPTLAIAAHKSVSKAPPRKRVATLGQSFFEFSQAVKDLLEGPTGAVTTYCTKFIKNYEELCQADYTRFLKNRIQEDLSEPLKYILR